MEQTAVGRQRKAGGRGRGRPPRTLWGTSRAQDWTLSVEGLFQDKWTAQRSLAAGRWAHRQRSPEAGRPAVTPPLSPENVKVKGTDSGTELPGLSPGSAASSVCLGRVTEILVLASVASSEKWDSQHAASRVWRVIESTAEQLGGWRRGGDRRPPRSESPSLTEAGLLRPPVPACGRLN